MSDVVLRTISTLVDRGEIAPEHASEAAQALEGELRRRARWLGCFLARNATRGALAQRLTGAI